MIIFLSILFACNTEENLFRTVQRCRTVLQEIMDVQQTRNSLMDDMQENTTAHNSGRLSKEAHLTQYVVWMETENTLYIKTSSLLDSAEEDGCL